MSEIAWIKPLDLLLLLHASSKLKALSTVYRSMQWTVRFFITLKCGGIWQVQKKPHCSGKNTTK
jgi:hypothetical protein